MTFDNEIAHELLASLELVLETTATLHGQVEAMLDDQAKRTKRKPVPAEDNDVFAALWARLDAECKDMPEPVADVAPVALPMAQPQEAEPEPASKRGRFELPEIKGDVRDNVFYFEQESYDAILDYLRDRYAKGTAKWSDSRCMMYLYHKIPEANVFSFDKVEFADLEFGVQRGSKDKVVTYSILPNGVAYVFSKHLDAKAFEFMVARMQGKRVTAANRHQWCDTLLADSSIRNRQCNAPETVSDWVRHSFGGGVVQDHAVMQPLKDARVIYHVDWTFQTVPSFYS